VFERRITIVRCPLCNRENEGSIRTQSLNFKARRNCSKARIADLVGPSIS
jgi:hypothetical protein